MGLHEGMVYSLHQLAGPICRSITRKKSLTVIDKTRRRLARTLKLFTFFLHQKYFLSSHFAPVFDVLVLCTFDLNTFHRTNSFQIPNATKDHSRSRERCASIKANGAEPVQSPPSSARMRNARNMPWCAQSSSVAQNHPAHNSEQKKCRVVMQAHRTAVWLSGEESPGPEARARSVLLAVLLLGFTRLLICGMTTSGAIRSRHILDHRLDWREGRDRILG